MWKMKPEETIDGTVCGLVWGTTGKANEGKVIGFEVLLEDGMVVNACGLTEEQSSRRRSNEPLASVRTSRTSGQNLKTQTPTTAGRSRCSTWSGSLMVPCVTRASNAGAARKITRPLRAN